MRSITVTPAGAALAFQEVGVDDGTVPTVFIGGLGASGIAAFLPVVGHPRLSSTGRKILLDLIGSGWSDHDDTFTHSIDDHAGTVILLLEGLGLPEVSLVGHSLGGSVAIAVAAQRPDLVSSLTVAEPNLDPGVGSFSVDVVSTDEDSFADHGHAALTRRLRAGHHDFDPDDFPRTVARWSGRGLHRTATSLLAQRPVTFREQLAAFAGPKRYISGALSDEDLQPLRGAGCDVRVVPDAGHVLMTDNLDGFVDALL